MDIKLVSAIIAGIISIIGIVVNIYINNKSNKNAIKKLKLEFRLEREKRLIEKFGELISRIENYKLVLMVVLQEIELNLKNINWNQLKEKSEISYAELISQWKNIQYEIREFKMIKSQQIGNFMHNNIASKPRQIQLLLESMTSDGREQNLDSLKSQILTLSNDLEALAGMILLERKGLSTT